VPPLPSLEDPAVIKTILAFLEKKGLNVADGLLPDCRASPSLPMGLFDVQLAQRFAVNSPKC
jgi:hypothetical protein